MVTKMSAPGRSFGGVADYCLHDRWVPGQGHPESAGRGGAATGRKLEKPVCHYSLNWAKDERPDRQEMRRAAAATLKALNLARIDHRFGNEGDFGRPERFSESFAIDPVQVE